MRLRQLLIAASTRFLPAVVVLIGAGLLAEPLLRRQNVAASLRGIYLPLALGEPLLLTFGAVAAFWLMRKRLDTRVLLSVGRNALAAVAAVVTLFVIAVFSQGAHMPLIITVNLFAGVFGTLVVFGAGRATPATV